MKRLVVVVGLALVVAACGGAAEQVNEEILERAAEAAGEGDVSIDISEDGDDVSVEFESGDASVSVGSGAEIPEGLEIPVPDGGDVVSSGTDGESVFVSVQYPKDRYDEIAAFYGDWTTASGEEWQESTATIDVAGETQRSAQWVSNGTSSLIIITDCFGVAAGGSSVDSVCVTISQSE